MKSFSCLSIVPINVPHVNLAIASIRAGGIGILDREFCQKNELDLAEKNLKKLIASVSDRERIGLRLHTNQIEESKKLLALLFPEPHWLILCGWEIETLSQTLNKLTITEKSNLLLEVLSLEQAKQIESLKLPIQGIVAKGHESGGWVSEDSAFILSQKILKQASLPVYIQGGIGMNTAAACRAAGAAGVVLDDQLWLMPESPLKPEYQQWLKALNGQEAIIIGERLNASCRVLSRPGFSSVSALQELAKTVEIAKNSPETNSKNWQKQAQNWIGWGDPKKTAWPMGQSIGMAAAIRDKYKITNKFIQAILTVTHQQIETAKLLKPLQPHGPLAASHRTKYPIVQGPMTRVSDQATFAQAVAAGGGLPMLALALMGGAQVETLLKETQQLLKDQSWGIGILGFVPQSLRKEQLEVVLEIKPPFALIAGGRPDQAAHLEAQGIATYLHVPTPTLLKMFLQQGARRFVFEGRECGGHVGPLSSFILWETMIETLLNEAPSGAESDIHVLFAGGIHDADSALMISTLGAPLAAKGINIGVLMGTAYIFTQEAVTHGAVVRDFQEQVIACQETINLETGPGHASRCAVTPFAQEFFDLRRTMMAEGRSAEEIKDTLEKLTLGRLRIASKGLQRNETGELVTVEPEQQIQNGMYMIGQVATLRHQSCSIEELHQEVSEDSSQKLGALDTVLTSVAKPSTPSDIAIIGISTLLPKAQYPEQFWDNILNQVNAITEIPSSRWDWRMYYDSDRHARDKVYSKWGGFLDDVAFDPLKFGIPPKSLKSIEPLQILTLEAVRRALENAGYADGDFDREHTSVILGAGGGLADLGGQYATRSEIPRFVAHPDQETWDRLPEWTEETFPGLLLNVIAGRVSNRFDLGGNNLTVDAACASSLAAIDLAVKELETGRANVAIAGGVDSCQSPFAFFCFSKTQALSPQGKARSFDQAADGIVISEGIAIVVLKRLADAQRDGDRIYAVIKAVAGSSDGKGLGLTAPRTVGQRKAVERAYEKAGVSPTSLSLYEAHGTGTVAGDRAELDTILETLTAHKAPSKSCVLGSVKTLIGHTKCTAGVTGLIKVALSLYHQVLPPHAGVENPLKGIKDPESPVYLLKQPQPWLKPSEHPRRAAVSAFGFGGTNFHAVVEEYSQNLLNPCLGSRNWPWELLILRAANRDALIQEIQSLQTQLTTTEPLKLRDLAYRYSQQAQNNPHLTACASLVVDNLENLKDSLEQLLSHLQGNETHPLPVNIQVGWQAQAQDQAIAFLFPGQGAQYPDMMNEVAVYWPEMRSALEFANSQLQEIQPPLLSQYIYPPSAYSEEEAEFSRKQLTQTQIAQPAIGTLEIGCLEIAKKLGLKAQMVAGHSYGEYGALHSAGVLSAADFLRLSAIRGQVMANACRETPGAMAVARISRQELSDRLKGFEEIILANHNAPLQSVVSGPVTAVQNLVEQLNNSGIKARMLAVGGAFHSELVASAQKPLQEAIAQTVMHLPTIPVYSNSTAQIYEPDVESIRYQLSQHLLSPVEFVRQIETMYEQGARVFIELGPRNILTNLTDQILEGKEHISTSFDGSGGGLRGFLTALGTLICSGVTLNLNALFESREIADLDITPNPTLSKNSWLLNGGSIRPQTEAVGYAGTLPPLTKTTKAQTPHQPSPLVETPAAVAPLTVSQPSSLPTATPSLTPTNNLPKQAKTPASKPPSIQSNLSSVKSKSVTMSQETSANYLPAVPSSDRVSAYQAYQETMRQFLHLQEQVMYHFLSGMPSSGTGTMAEESVKSPQPMMVPPRIVSAPVAPEPPVFPTPPTINGNEQKHQQPAIVVTESQEKNVANAPIFPPTVVAQTNKNEIKHISVAPGISLIIDQASLQKILVNLVSERTGYPPEMLGINQDLEAELGIDSIKRVEILGALQTALPEGMAKKIQGQMESLTRVKSLQELIQKLLSTTGTEAKNQQVSVATAPKIDQESLQKILVNLVSERTGYPPEMLGINQDLEAELGIDSIKRVEILGALQTALPEGMSKEIQGQMESLTRVKSLQELIQKLLTVSALNKEEVRLGK